MKTMHTGAARLEMTNDRVPRAIWGQALITVLGAFTTMLSATIGDAALPAIGRTLHTSPTNVQWVASGYLLALAATVPLSTYMVRRFGPRRLWLACLALFATFSTWCALSESIDALIIGRTLQGASGGLLVPAGQVLIGSVIPKKWMGRVLSTVGIGVVSAPLVGTTLGSVIIGHFSWSWLFWIDLPLAAATFVAGLRWLPEVDAGEAGRADWTGLLLVVGGLSLLIYGGSAIGEAGGLGSTHADGYAAAGVLTLILFTVYEWRRRSPALQLRLFTLPVFTAAVLASFFGGVVNFGAQIILPLYFVQVHSESSLAAGLLIGTQVIGTVIATPLAGRLTDRYGGGRLLLVGGVLTALATIPLAIAGTGTSYVWFCGVLFVRGFGVALGTIPAMTVVMASVRRDQLADAAPINNMLQRVGATVGTALIALLYADHLTGVTPTAAAHAFNFASWWLVAGACLLIAPAWLLSRAERRPSQGPDTGGATRPADTARASGR